MQQIHASQVRPHFYRDERYWAFSARSWSSLSSLSFFLCLFERLPGSDGIDPLNRFPSRYSQQ